LELTNFSKFLEVLKQKIVMGDRHYCAVENLHAEVVYSLVQVGAQVNVVNTKHQNPLHLISQSPKGKIKVCSDKLPYLQGSIHMPL
jgi:hypothetical protein